MMLLSLLEEQKRVMEEFAEQNKNNSDGTATKADGESDTSKATTTSPAIQTTQQWHTAETDQSLVLLIDVTGFKLENLELKVENGLLSLRGHRTNVLGDVFELFRTKAVDPMLYEDTGIEARCENLDESSILRISIPKKEYTVKNDGAIPIQVVECLNEAPREQFNNTTTATFIEDDKKEQTDGIFQDDIFITEAEIVFERVEDEEALGQVETVQDESVASFEAAQALHSGATDDVLNEVSDNDSATTHTWEDLVAGERNEDIE